MQKRKTNTMSGFTIIEVVLVLAIAGLIFLMVFIALPALQRSQRDTHRKDNYSTIMAAITAYQSNNNGKIPTKLSELKTNNYLDDNVADPGSGKVYNTVNTTFDTGNAAVTANTVASEGDPVKIYVGRDCDGHTGLGNRRYALVGYLESGRYCEDN